MEDVDLVILSIIAESPRYGHEVHQVIDRRGLRRWLPVGFSSVFYVLNKLEKADFASGEFPFEDAQSARKRYTITDAGSAVLKTHVVDMLAHARTGVGRFELALLAAHPLPPAMVQGALYERRVMLARQIERHRRALEKPTEDGFPFDVQRRLNERAIALLEQDLDWLTDFEVQWEDYHALPPASPAEQAELPQSAKPTAEANPRPRDDTQPAPSPKDLQKFRRPPLDE